MIDMVNTWQIHFVAVRVFMSDIANLALRVDGYFLLSQRQALH